ncbi:NACHT domain-containing protein [Streptomyces sp. NPDC050523]|uniref:NACHT domain-containing protein n=1 Tax=Streptomyces sp. NPDC050523 TaxID=3365622 RepID=UPI0037A76B8D
MRYEWPRSLRSLPFGDSDLAGPFDASRRDAGRGLRLDELRNVPVVVVLGERGAGKSVALEQEHDLLSSQGAKVAPVLHLGRDVDIISAASILQEHLNNVGEGPRYVLMDGLDEGLNDVPGLDKTLWRQLRSLPDQRCERLRLRITCRTTRWPKQLLSQLGERWPDPGQIEVMTLEPLTRQDVVTAAEQRGLNTAEFAERVTGRSLEALAQHPVTLIPLLDAQADGRELPKTVAEAYEQACQSLCTESWEEGFEQRQERPTVDHLLEVARWTAAALQFSRIPALTEQEPVPEGALSLDSLSGPSVPGIVPQLECRRRELLHLTESGLLMAVGQRGWVFAHRSYQEYLAAQYLRDRIAPAVQSELLWAGSGPARHIVPEHEEVAARLAVEVPELFEELLVHDPRVLLLADLPSLPDTSRQRVAEALLDAAPDEGSVLIDFPFLERLAHPALAGQLAPFLDHDADRNQTYLALWIAAECRSAELTPVLLSFARDTAVPTRFRSFALSAIAEKTVQGEAVTALRDLAADAKTSVAEAALEHLWPQHLRLTEYLDLLPS